jgi:hypothetical protein
MFTLINFIDIYSAYVDDIDTSRTNVDVSNKYKHIRESAKSNHTESRLQSMKSWIWNSTIS